MYCVKCGVELADSERKCPLCQTPVYFPNLPEPERTYPSFTDTREEINPRGMYFIVSCLLMLAALISVVCDITLNSSIVWSGYVVCGILLTYIIFILPNWFSRRLPAVFLPIDFAAIGGFLLYISVNTGGWFLSFAFPILGALALIVCSAVILIYYIRRGHLYIFGGTSIALGLFVLLIEILIHLNFNIVHSVPFVWSIYPFLAFFLLGLMLMVIAIVRPFRESLKKFFAL